uniref:Transmembrane protein n=1 Tax=Romanomermis culicivorax TaxID=13658 RepID=A0A915J108_ROMCU
MKPSLFKSASSIIARAMHFFGLRPKLFIAVCSSLMLMRPSLFVSIVLKSSSASLSRNDLRWKLSACRNCINSAKFIESLPLSSTVLHRIEHTDRQMYQCKDKSKEHGSLVAVKQLTKSFLRKNRLNFNDMVIVFSLMILGTTVGLCKQKKMNIVEAQKVKLQRNFQRKTYEKVRFSVI